METKQRFTLAKFKEFEERLLLMQDVITSINPKDKKTVQDYIGMAKRFARYINNCSVEIRGVIGGPFFDANLAGKIANYTNLSVITLTNEQYNVSLRV